MTAESPVVPAVAAAPVRESVASSTTTTTTTTVDKENTSANAHEDNDTDVILGEDGQPLTKSQIKKRQKELEKAKKKQEVADRLVKESIKNLYTSPLLILFF